MQTLSDIASVLIPVELPCDDCDGTGQREAPITNVRSLFNPYEFIKQSCATCKGTGLKSVEICALCEQEESICARVCKPALCCGKDPGDCACPNGIELYQEAYGLPAAA